MSEDPPSNGRAGVAGIGGVVLVVAGLLGVMAIREQPGAPEVEVEERVGAPMVTAIRDLARLESAAFHMERVVDLRERQRRLFGLLRTQDAILLVAAADVSAGVDLSRMRDGDIIIEPSAGRTTIVLPAPEVFDVRLDNHRTYVHTRATDALGRRSETLESRARQRAETMLREAAIDAGILDRARQNARQTMTALARGFGYDDIQIRFRDARDAEPAVLDVRAH